MIDKTFKRQQALHRNGLTPPEIDSLQEARDEWNHTAWIRERRGACSSGAYAAQRHGAAGAATPDRFDIVVAGAGHNSLVTAAYLSKAGFRCVVLEGRPTVGGGVKSAQFTLRGFIHDTCSSAHNGIQDNPLIRDKEIDLRVTASSTSSPIRSSTCLFSTALTLRSGSTRSAPAPNSQKSTKKTATPTGACGRSPSVLTPTKKFWQRRLAMSYWDVIRMNFEDDHCRSFMLACPWSQQPPQFPMTGRVAYGAFQPAAPRPPAPERRLGKIVGSPGALHRSA